MVNSQPIPEDASPAEVRKMAEAARQEAVALQQQNDRITKALETATAAAAAATAAINAIRDSGTLTNRANSIPSQARRKRPDLPAFDKNNIHIWIKRIEAAYAREDVIEPKQKFAFLESIIGTNMGPTINNFMFGESTQAKWNEFLQHLIDTFGPTKQQRCSTYLDGVKRDGRRPSDLLACIRDKGKDVTIDDLEKQLIWRELPSDVQKLLQDKLEGKTADETALLADQHFDQQGKPLNSSASINNVDNSYSCPTAPSDPLTPPNEQGQFPLQRTTASWVTMSPDSDVNAVNARQDRAASRGNSNNNRFTAAFSPSGNDTRSRSSGNNNRQRSNSRPPQHSSRNSSNHSATTPAPEGEMSPCSYHKVHTASNICKGPNCPLHASASKCLSRHCQVHQGNGRGGRR